MKSKAEKSVERVKTTTTSLAGLMGVTAAEILHPGAGAALVGGIKVLFEHLKNWRKSDQEYRLMEFHKHLLKGLPPKKSEELINRPFAMEDYYSFMRYLLDDEESAKAGIYAKIFRALIQGEIESNFKQLIVRSARELSVLEFHLINKYYAKRKDLLELNRIASTADPVKSHSIQNLIHLGYLLDKGETRPPCPTALLDRLAQILQE